MRLALGALIVAAMAAALAGVGMGSAPAERAPAPDAAAVSAARARIAAGGASVARGRELFAEQGCDRCHALAAVGAEGLLGPRLDALDEDADDLLESIAEPRGETTDGFAERLMPTDYARRLGIERLRELAAFVALAGGGDVDRGGRERKGRGAGRGDDDREREDRGREREDRGRERDDRDRGGSDRGRG